MNSARDVFALRRAGRFDEALAMARALRAGHPGQLWNCRALGWCLHDKVRACIWSGEPDAIPGLLTEYRSMAVVERPSMLHSAMLSAAVQCSAQLPGFIGFVRWWDPASFQITDLQRQKSDDGEKTYPSLAEKLAKALYRSLRVQPEAKDDAEWAAGFIGSLVAQFPDNEWLPYYQGKLLIAAERRSQARELVLPVIRSKRTEFWAWELLADACGDADPAGRLACLARAVLCPAKDPSFLVNVHEALARALFAAGERSAAKTQILEADRIRISKGWRSSMAAMELLSDLVRAGVPTEEEAGHLERLRTLAQKADDLLLEGLPWFPGVVTGLLPADGDRAGATFLKVRLLEAEADLMLRHSKFPAAADFARGTPVSVQVTEARGHMEVCALAPRDAAEWDLIPPVSGVVSAVQATEGRTWIALGQGRTCAAPHRIFPEAASLFPGDPVEVRLRTNPKTQRIETLSIEPAGEGADPALWRDIDGELRISPGGGFGFVGDAFVPPDVISKGGFEAGEVVHVGAVADWDRARNRPSWKVVTIERKN